MRKFGLNREQRTLLIRSTGGSSRFLDVERILLASDLEDQREDRKPVKLQLKPGRREAYAGYAIVDTGCTTSVVGQETAKSLTEYFQKHGMPPPDEVKLLAVELKGFHGKTETPTAGLKWTVCLGKLQGQITTYVIPGVTPFLLSRRVVEAMEAVLDLQHHTMTSEKHDLHQTPLRQASNGHLLSPLFTPALDLEVAQCDHQQPYEPNTNSDDVSESDSELPVEAFYEDVSWVELDNKVTIPDASIQHLKKSIGSLRKASLRLVLSRLASNPKQVRAELKQWLSDQASKLDSKVGLIEVFLGRARLSEVYEKETEKVSIRLGLKDGQDFTKLHDRRCLLLLIAYCCPEHVWFSFPCKPWGPWTCLNLCKGDSTFEKIMGERAVARRYLHNVSEVWNLQCALGGHAHCENPLASQAWAELTLDDAWEVRVDQCALGLRSPKARASVLKPTKIVTTDEQLAAGLVTCRCDGKHQHEHLAGKFQGINLTSWAETHPTSSTAQGGGGSFRIGNL
eukprot:s521_g21.t1